MSVPVEGFAGGDRVSLDIPRVQQELMEKIVALGKPVVLVVFNGSAIAINWARDHVPAIVEAWYPGQAGGQAVADVLFGDYNPAGRLPVTFYKSADQLPPFTDYRMQGRTYRYFAGEPLWAFGYGLSYTTFAYRNIKLPARAQAGEEIKLSVEVENTGKITGDEVVQVYVTQAGRPASAPIRQLAAFGRISLRAGEKKTVQLTVDARRFSATASDGRRRVEPAAWEISVGGSQRGAVSGSLTLAGPAKELN